MTISLEIGEIKLISSFKPDRFMALNIAQTLRLKQSKRKSETVDDLVKKVVSLEVGKSHYYPIQITPPQFIQQSSYHQFLQVSHPN